MIINPPHLIMNHSLEDINIGIIGLGYVGLPLACLFAGKYPVTGTDINAERVAEIAGGVDKTGELSSDELARVIGNGLNVTDKISAMTDCNVYIITVPTPVDIDNIPDLTPLRDASRSVASVLRPGDTVIYESTVYPGATEEECVPLLEEGSGLRYNLDFHVGYSPERVNPGDREHRVENISKITSGSSAEAADFVDRLYASVLKAPTFRAASIKTAEAAKILENTQRDINIAFINEAAMVFNALGIDTAEVIKAASSKWNFVPIRPGLVGGHCIGVDPYYFIYKARKKGMEPRLMSEARRVNNYISEYVAGRVRHLMKKKGIPVKDSKILLLGFAFKENCTDVRNTKVTDIYNALSDFTDNIDIYDPYVAPKRAKDATGMTIINDFTQVEKRQYDAVIYCVDHDEFARLDIRRMLRHNSVVYDVKSALDKALVDERL